MEHRDRFSIIAVSCALLLTAGVFVALHIDEWTPAVNARVPEASNLQSAASTTPAPVPSDPGPGVQDPAPPEPEHSAVALASHPAEGPERAAELPAEAVAAVARGQVPELVWLQLPTMRDVLVRRDADGLLVVAAGTQRRYLEVVDGITALPPSEVVGWVRQDHRLTVAVDGESAFERDLRLAVEHLLEVELSPEPAGMRSAGPQWAFADADLEALSAAQKHLLLMHRADARRLHSWLTAVHTQFGWQQVMASPEVVVAARLDEHETDASGLVYTPEEDVVTTLP